MGIIAWFAFWSYWLLLCLFDFRNKDPYQRENGSPEPSDEDITQHHRRDQRLKVSGRGMVISRTMFCLVLGPVYGNMRVADGWMSNNLKCAAMSRLLLML